MTSIEAICAEYSIKIIPANKYPDLGETRAVACLNRILSNYGEAHLRLVLTTAAETANNKAALEAAFLWCVSDLVLDCADLVERDTTRWLEVFDKAPVDEMLWILRGHKHQRHMLRGMLFERIRTAFRDQMDLFQRRAA